MFHPGTLIGPFDLGAIRYLGLAQLSLAQLCLAQFEPSANELGAVGVGA